MSEDQYRLLTLVRQAPARLNVEQTAAILNCAPHDIPVLVRAGLLKPLGRPPKTGVKYFLTRQITELSQNQAWMDRAANAIYKFWHEKNGRRSNGGSETSNS